MNSAIYFGASIVIWRGKNTFVISRPDDYAICIFGTKKYLSVYKVTMENFCCRCHNLLFTKDMKRKETQIALEKIKKHYNSQIRKQNNEIHLRRST